MENINETIKMAEDKLIEVRAAKKELDQARALANAPVENVEKENRSKVIREVQDGMLNKRAITLGGTGNVSIVRDLIKAAGAKNDILNRFRYFYGPNQETVIPVWNGGLGLAQEVSENGTWTDTDTATLATKNLVVKAFCKSIPVSNETLKLSAVAFESELNKIIADLYADTIAYQVFNATGDGAFKSIYDGAKEITVSSKSAITGLAEFALDMADKMDYAVIGMKPGVYAKITASDSNAKEKAWAKELIENKTIEGVPVVLSSKFGDEILGGDLGSYCIAVADELSIEPKKQIGSLATVFDVSMYLAGTPTTNLFVMKQGE